MSYVILKRSGATLQWHNFLPMLSFMASFPVNGSPVQEASEVEAQISGLANCMLAAHCATAVIDGRAYAVLSLAAGELQPEGALAGLTLHWGCTQHACQPWAPPPAGWHTIPDRSFAAGRFCLLYPSTLT